MAQCRLLSEGIWDGWLPTVSCLPVPVKSELAVVHNFYFLLIFNASSGIAARVD
jgi:hypothetical protein